jgi:hypothetical protein
MALYHFFLSLSMYMYIYIIADPTAGHRREHLQGALQVTRPSHVTGAGDVRRRDRSVGGAGVCAPGVATARRGHVPARLHEPAALRTPEDFENARGPL